jgi:hypothetical protein
MGGGRKGGEASLRLMPIIQRSGGVQAWKRGRSMRAVEMRGDRSEGSMERKLGG